jgi:hypothetical protein
MPAFAQRRRACATKRMSDLVTNCLSILSAESPLVPQVQTWVDRWERRLCAKSRPLAFELGEGPFISDSDVAMSPRPKSYPKVECQFPSPAQRQPDAKNQAPPAKSLIFYEPVGKRTDFSRSRGIEKIGPWREKIASIANRRSHSGAQKGAVIGLFQRRIFPENCWSTGYWRRGWDSNPRYACTYNGSQGRVPSCKP